MRKERSAKNTQKAEARLASAKTPPRDFPAAILDEASKDFSFEVSSVQVADSGVVFVVGWSDDRSSKLRHIRVRGKAWSTTIDSRFIGRHRRADVEGSPATPRNRFSGFWALAAHDRGLIEGKSCSVELTLSNGMSRTSDVPIEFIGAEDLRARFAKFWGALTDADRLPPLELTYLEQALKRPVAKASMPKHNIENVTVADDGGVFLNGWVDDSGDALAFLRLSGLDGHANFRGRELARTFRADVQAALGLARPREFGFWGFAANEIIQKQGNAAHLDIIMSNGARQRHDVTLRRVDAADLRSMVLGYLASAQYLGNPQLEAGDGLENGIGAQIVDFNLRISRKIKSQPYVERFGRQARMHRGSIVVCLYGKPEYLFLQNALFSNRPGIEDYEFVYVCNSPELAEPLLRSARIAASSYDIDQTVIILPGNAGFGAANNAAASFAQSDRVLIVNPDVFPFDQDWAAKHTNIVDNLPREQTNIFGVPLYYDDGSLMHGGMYFEADRGVSMEQSGIRSIVSLRVEHYGKGAPPLTAKFTRARPVPAITGAFMSLDRRWFESLGGFSEEYVFGHYEDADLCLKSLARGISPWIHDIKLWHLEGQGASKRLPAHEGASIVNRWLFNRRWAAKVLATTLGPSPELPVGRSAARTEPAYLVTSPPPVAAVVGAGKKKAHKAPKVAKPVVLPEETSRNHPDSGMDLVFGGN